MPLTSTPRAARLEDFDEGVRFNMSTGDKTISVFVSCQALEGIDAQPHVGGTIERFTEYRAQFEEIARDKYDKGHWERDGNVCIRSRDLPARDH
jgi:Protein of unknown function (DUF1488)